MLVKHILLVMVIFHAKKKPKDYKVLIPDWGCLPRSHRSHRQATKVHHMEAPSHRAGGAFPGGPRVSDGP